MFTNSPNMGFPLPTVSNEPGPQFAQDVNQALSVIDSHTHSPGNGLPIGSQSININTDLSFNITNATNLRTVRFVSTTASSGTDVGCVYVRGVDLFYNDLNANPVRITQNGGLSTTATFIGSISTTAITSANGGIVATSGFIRMDNNTDFLAWRDAANNADDKIYFDNTDSFNIIGQGYNFKFPSIATSATSPLGWSPNGSVVVNPPNVSFAGKAVQESGNNIVVSNTNAANSLAVVRGWVGSGGDVGQGEGFSLNSFSAGFASISITAPFSDFPVVTANLQGTSGQGNLGNIQVRVFSTSAIGIYTISSGGSLTNESFSFIAIGQRA